jgi:parallel beta-helix repeat protein
MEIEFDSGYNIQMDSDYFIETSPIAIESNQDLEDLSLSGSGTQEDPYIIERLHIVATGTQNSSISVFYTSAYIIIRDCYLETDWACIDIRHTAVGTVRIENNTCTSNSGGGAGIVVWRANNSTVVGNTCMNLAQGIHLNEAACCNISSNNITNNNYQGINIRLSNYNTITDNIVTNTSQHGVALVRSSRFNIIHHNHFIDNGQEETYRIDGEERGALSSQGFDEGNNNTWYDATTEEGNWWSDYSGTSPYSIDGPSNSTDPYPIIADNHTQNFGLEPLQFTVIIVSVGGVVILAAGLFLRSRSAS